MGLHPCLGDAVLIVGRTGAHQERIAGALARAGFAVLQTPSAASAAALIDRYPIEAVLTDRTEAAALRAGTVPATLPLIVKGPETGRVEALRAGASDYMTEQADPSVLIATLQARLRSQAAWRAQLQGLRRDRASLASLLRRVRVRSTPELTAAGLCHEFVGVCGLASAAIVAFTPRGDARLLAMDGQAPACAASGAPLPGRLSSALRARAVGGPWVISSADLQPDLPDLALSDPVLAEPGASFAAYAPLRSRDALVGLLVIAGRGRQTAETLSGHLSAAVDFAAVALALLVSTLHEWGLAQNARAELEWVLGGEGFRPVFQPIREVRTRRVAGYEALTRFTDGAPAELRFAAATAAGLGLEIEAATLDAAIHGSTPLPDDAWLSVNVSPGFVLEGRYLSRAVRASPRPLVLELTEHDPIDDYAAIRAAVDRLGPAIRLSIDDTGTGYACLNHVLSLQPDFVKLDRYWVHDIDTDPARQALVAGVEHFASRTGAAVIAEGVETSAELTTVEGLGIPLAQGFLFGRPGPVPPSRQELS